MAGRLSMGVVMMMVAAAMMQLQSSEAQTVHVVGNALGWTVPPAGAVAYSTWAATQTFTVGDVLFFNFTTGFHDATEVTQAAYGPCTIANPISQVATGPANFTLTTAGTHYYICTVGSHCSLGQKVTISVSAASSPSPAPLSATPPPSPTASPPVATPVPATSTPPSSSSAPAPSPTATPPPAPTTATPPSAPSPAGGVTSPPPPPPSPSSAPAFAVAALPVTFLSIALAFFY